MVVVEADTPGFPRGPTLGKVGKKARIRQNCTSTAARCPEATSLGLRGAFSVMRTTPLTRERLAIALGALAAAIKALALALDYTAERTTLR